MKKIILLLTINLIVHCINAQQPTKPLEFLNFKPKWSHYSYASQLPDSTQYNWTASIRKPLIIGNDLYLLLNNTSNFDQGYLIEKLNINTGELLANHQHFDKRKNERSWGFSLKKNGNYVDLLSFKEDSRKIVPFVYHFWSRSNYNLRQFCTNNLAVCDSVVTNPLDTNTHTLNCYRNASYLYKKGNNVLNIESSGFGPLKRAYFTIIELNEKGYMIDSSEISIYFKYSTIHHVQMYEYDQSKYIAFAYATNDDNINDLEVKMIYFDVNFAVEKVLDITQHLKNATLLYLHYEDAENFVIGSQQDSLVSNYKKATYNFYVFNHKGEKVDEISMKNANLGRYEYMFATLLKPSKKILAVVRRLTPDNKVKFEFMLSNNKGGADLTKTIYPNRHIRNYYPYSMPNNHVLCEFRDTDSTDTKYKTPPSWNYWVMFSPEDLNFPVALKEPILQSFSFYPNPSSEQINIKTDFDFDAIHVYSIEGRLMQAFENQNNTLDISNLPSGLYFFELRQQGKTVTKMEKFIKIE
jgi:hypothetical protein